MSRHRTRGFSLIELVVSMLLAGVLFAMSFSGLNKARTSGSSRGLATAVESELRLAREKALAKGSPVAVVFDPGVTRSLFFLEGDTMPAVTRSVDYSGDYPNGSISVATYPGPSFGSETEVPGSKSEAWQERLNDWLSENSRYSDGHVFMFTPNGTVVTNGVPVANELYRVIVATGMEVSGNTLVAAGEPQTVTVSQSGSVETFGHLLDNSSGVNGVAPTTTSVTPPPRIETSYQPKIPQIHLTRVTPPAEMVDGQEFHVLDKGEYLTLEIFASSMDGRALYASWKDTHIPKEPGPTTGGAFSVEKDENNDRRQRMEFFPEFDINNDGIITDDERDIWRSVWTWTPPAEAQPGDQYKLDVEVTDATASKKAAINDVKPAAISPPGEIIFESNRLGGRWHLYTVWADGSRTVRLTEGPHDYRCASVTADGKFIAYERNGNEVWVMNTDGTGMIKIASGASTPTISPTGSSIAYMVGSQVVVRRIDSQTMSSVSLASEKTYIIGLSSPGNRIAYSADGRYIYYTSASKDRIKTARINFTSSGGITINEASAVDGETVTANVANLPEFGGLYAGRQGRVFYHADDQDPFVGAYDTVNGVPNGTPTYRMSLNELEAFPAISPREDLLLYCRRVGGKYQIFRTETSGGNWTTFNAGDPQITQEGENLRPAWIHQGGKF